MSAITLCLAAGLILVGLPRGWRLITIVPAWIAALGFFQVRENTCVALAARGLRNMDTGDERITDPIELHRVRQQSRSVHIQAALLALAVAAFFTLLVPV
ncbi:MAG TPA: hypothetical protein VMS40_13445 [Vicinamibacterales bacterium]|nr:hypothetical protein [Vicinamibacterales bacterium]